MAGGRLAGVAPRFFRPVVSDGAEREGKGHPCPVSRLWGQATGRGLP